MPDIREAIQLIEAVAGTNGSQWDVLLIETGTSKNRNHYTAEVLRTAVPLFEGVPAYRDHEPGQQVNRKVGVFRRPEFAQVEIAGRQVEGIRARFKVMDSGIRAKLNEAMALDEPEFLGFSINAKGNWTPRKHEGQAVNWVDALTQVHSVDVVAEASAGGRVIGLVESVQHEGDDMSDELKAMLEAMATQLGALSANVAAVKERAPTETPVREATPAQAAATAAAADHEALMEAHRGLINAARIREALAAAPTLSEPGQALVRRDLDHHGERGLLAEDDCTARVTEQMDYEAKLRPVLAASIGGEQARIGFVPAEKIHRALQGWFAGEPVDGIAPLRSLKEGYRRLNGIDADDLDFLEFADAFACVYKGERTHLALQESLTTATWGQIFADVLYLRLITEYRRMLEIMDWRLVCSDIVPVDDFRTYHYARVGGYADLGTVAEGATYPTLTTPGDEEQTFSVAKRGGMDDWTLEAAANDKTNKVRQLPRLMADAALRTLYKYVMNLITTDNPTLGYDSVALYDSTHGNTGTTALSVSGLNTTQIAMRDQSPFGIANELLSARNKIRYLITPNELEARAERIVAPSPEYTFALSSSADADTQLDPARWRNKGIRPITYDYLTDATDWWAVADPAQVPTVVMGFLNGRQEPQLFMQDSEDSDTKFNADKTRAKVRHIYGGAVLDHRSFFRQVVA